MSNKSEGDEQVANFLTGVFLLGVFGGVCGVIVVELLKLAIR